MILQINVYSCVRCGEICIESEEPAIWSDPLVSPPKGWGLEDNYEILCSKCFVEYKKKQDDTDSLISQLSQREIFFVFKQVAHSCLSWLEQYQGSFNTLDAAKICIEDCCKRHGDYGEVALFSSDGFKKIWTYEELGNLSSEMFGWFEV